MRSRKIFTINFGFKSIFIFFANISSKLPIFDKFSQNSPFYCNFGPKMVEKMRKYKELGNNALSLKWGKIRIFLKNIHPCSRVKLKSSLHLAKCVQHLTSSDSFFLARVHRLPIILKQFIIIKISHHWHKEDWNKLFEFFKSPY